MKLPTLFNNPAVTICSSIASIISVPLAFYFYFQSISKPDLTYVIHPIRSVVVDKNKSTKLSATFDGKPIDDSLVIAQVAIWNRGNKSIRHQDFLENPSISLPKDCKVLDAIISKKSRDIIDLQCSTTNDIPNRVNLDWRILEQNDGGIVQITYTGNPNSKITVSSTIEGQQLPSQGEFLKENKALLIMSALAGAFSLAALWYFSQSKKPIFLSTDDPTNSIHKSLRIVALYEYYFPLVGSIVFTALSVVGLYQYFHSQSYSPPFTQ